MAILKGNKEQGYTVVSQTEPPALNKEVQPIKPKKTLSGTLPKSNKTLDDAIGEK